MDNHLEHLLAYLAGARGFDFTAYKRPSLTRRIQARMQALGVEGYEAYQDVLEADADEFPRLFDSILINVTSFFRDPPVWEFLAEHVVPQIIASKGGEGPIRVWSAACASGEEPYTIAMVLAEAMGREAFVRRVKIYGTDVSEGELARARLAVYTEREVESVPTDLRQRYFHQGPTGYIFDRELRHSTVFGRHNLIEDSPISRVGLLVCRNALMYFNAETQARIVRNFRFALLPSGHLLLGKAEMLLASPDVFAPLNLPCRVFVKSAIAPPRNLLDYARWPGGNGGRGAVQEMSAAALAPSPGHGGWVQEAAQEAMPIAQVVIADDGGIAMVNASACELFGMSPADVGRPAAEFSFYYRPVDLAPHLAMARADGRPVLIRELAWPGPGGEERSYDLRVTLLLGPDARPVGVSAAYIDVTLLVRLKHELQMCSEERETAHEELQTTNEELQSTVEELETTNEEIQSTNEELETMNEELHSSNEQLRSMNDLLSVRGRELLGVNGFWRSVIGCIRSAVVIIDRDFGVLVWNDRARDLWGLREEETLGKHLLVLDIGLPVDRLKGPILACLNHEGPAAVGANTVTLDATNRRGRAVRCRVTCTPLAGALGAPVTPRPGDAGADEGSGAPAGAVGDADSHRNGHGDGQQAGGDGRPGHEGRDGHAGRDGLQGLDGQRGTGGARRTHTPLHAGADGRAALEDLGAADGIPPPVKSFIVTEGQVAGVILLMEEEPVAAEGRA